MWPLGKLSGVRTRMSGLQVVNGRGLGAGVLGRIVPPLKKPDGAAGGENAGQAAPDDSLGCRESQVARTAFAAARNVPFRVPPFDHSGTRRIAVRATDSAHRDQRKKVCVNWWLFPLWGLGKHREGGPITLPVGRCPRQRAGAFGPVRRTRNQ
jgi:hypothetical protein